MRWKTIPLVLLLIVPGATVLAQADDPVVGRWEGEGVALTVAGADEYQVVVEALGAEFPGTAFFDGTSLDGSFTSNGEEFFFQGRIQPDGTMLLETEQTEYALTRVSAPAAPAAPTRNPLALAKQQQQAAPSAAGTPGPASGRRYGTFRMTLPEGWSGQVDPQGGVQLTAPGAPADGSEAYAVAFIPNIEDPTSAQAVGAAGMLLGQAAQLARVESTEMESAGRPAAKHELVLEQLQRRLNAYMAASHGGMLTVFASGLDEKVEARDAQLRAILDGLSIDAQAAAAQSAQPSRETPEQAQADPPAPADGEPLQIRLDANAPPFIPGRTSDGDSQSQQWVARLSGKLLTQMESYASGGGGINSRDRMYLAPDGRFEYAGSSLVSVDVGSTAASGGRSSAQGWWRVLTVNNMSYLGIAIQGVPQEIYSLLAARGQETYIDGKRTYVTVPQ